MQDSNIRFRQLHLGGGTKMNPAANGICCLTNTLSGRLYTTISDAGIDGFFFWTGVQACGESLTQKMRITTPHNRSHLQRKLPFRSASFPKRHWYKQKRQRSETLHNNGKRWLHAGDLHTPANIHDSKSAYALAAMLAVVSPWIRCIYADRGYRGKFIEKAKHDLEWAK